MTDKQDQTEAINAISMKLENITTNDIRLNNLDRSSNHQYRSPQVCTRSSMNRFQERIQSIKTGSSSPIMKKTKNVPEKIVFVVDTIREMGCTNFEMGDGTKVSPLLMIKRAMEIFVNAKNSINSKHQFALMQLTNDSCDWLLPFTNDIKEFVRELNKIEEIPLDEHQQFWDLTELFEEINSHIEVEFDSKPPTSLTRVILIYSRSHCEPQLSDSSTLQICMACPYFFLDVFYVHESPTEDNDCENIYHKLCELDTRQDSYIFEVGRNAASLHNNMAKLIAHPLQRPKQDEACYSIVTDEISAETSAKI